MKAIGLIAGLAALALLARRVWRRLQKPDRGAPGVEHNAEHLLE